MGFCDLIGGSYVGEVIEDYPSCFVDPIKMNICV
jgi:hypothetical protein